MRRTRVHSSPLLEALEKPLSRATAAELDTPQRSARNERGVVMSTSDAKVLLVGVDGGASGVRAWAVRVRGERGRVAFETEGAPAERTYAGTGGFAPVALDVQLAQRDAPQLDDAERAAARERIHCCAGAIVELARRLSARRLLVGACMPGLKTADGRGIAVLRHGPRQPALASEIEASLVREGLELAHPIARLLSDGEASAIGEDVGVGGALRDVETGAYIGGGTGISEAFKIAGQVIGMDALAPHFKKAWELRDAHGRSFEDRLSMSALNAAWSELRGHTRASLTIEEAARHGDPAAREVLSGAAIALAELCVSRARSIADVEIDEGEPRTRLLLERIVIGQQLGKLCADARLDPWLRARASAEFRARIAPGVGETLARRYLALPGERFVASTLRAAPAIGAAVSAFAATLPGSTGTS